MRIYVGSRDADGCQVLVFENDVAHPLRWRLDLDNHSPTGFEWGYGGSGPAQLALALLADALGEDARAVELHQQFKWKIIANLDRVRPWRMTQVQIRNIAADIAKEGA